MRNVLTLAIFFLALHANLPAGFAATPSPPPAPEQPIELGTVTWLRDYDQAAKRALAEGKPIFILFQEVPGCHNCTRYGEEILSHPLIVESIETDFVPLAIFNNKGGSDAKTLKRFGEPAWNNPVVHLVDAGGRDLVPRLASFGSTGQLTTGMVTALEKFCGRAPSYLSLVAEEHRGLEGQTAMATYETACFWTGEAFFGEQPGVVGTEAGWQDSREVVRVRYDAATTAPQVLAKAAAQKDYHAKENGKFRLDREPKYYLLHSRYAGVPMTALQASRVNAALGHSQRPDGLLSPRQLALLTTTAPQGKKAANANGNEPLKDQWRAAVAERG